MDIKVYLKNVFELEKEMYTLKRAINWLKIQENRIDVTHKEIEIPRKAESMGSIDSAIAAIGGFILGIIVGIPVAIVIQIIKAIAGKEDANIILIIIVLGVIGAAGGIWLDKSENDYQEEKYENDIKAYNTSVQAEKLRVRMNLQKKNNLIAQRNFLEQKRNTVEQTLKKLYGLNVIYPKYRNFIAIATIYEYFDSGRCCTLEGHEGAYNIYENEIRLNMILSKLDDVINHLEEIKNNQYKVYSAINEGNRKATELYQKSMQLIDNTNAIVENTAITAYNSYISAKNTEILKYIELYS